MAKNNYGFQDQLEGKKRHISYGPDTQKRVKQLLTVLLDFANHDLEECDDLLRVEWIKPQDKKLQGKNVELRVWDTSLGKLAELVEKHREQYKYSGTLTQEQIRFALRDYLEKFLKIFEDQRNPRERAGGTWEFKLKLWSKDKTINLSKFDELWKTQHPKQQLEAENIVKTPPPCIEIRLKGKFAQAPTSSREDDLKQIADCLLNINRQRLRNIVILWGSIGCGKTILALLSCCQDKILRHFTGGVFWVDLEEEQNPVRRLKYLYKELTKSEVPCQDRENINTLCSELLGQWSNQPYLIVLDNVKNKEDLDHFYKSTTEYCTLMIATRNKSHFTSYNSIDIQVEPLQPDETVLLLEYEFNQRGLIDKNKVKQLVDQLYEWPLLFSLIRNKIDEKIRQGYDPNSALDFIIKLINLENEGWKVFESEISDHITISLNFLSIDKQDFFKEMVIFPTNISVPLSVVKRLWGRNELETESLCGDLYGLALLKEFNPSQQTIRLISYLSQFLKQMRELKEALPEIHNKLLKSYEKEYQIKLGNALPEQLVYALSRDRKYYDEMIYLERFYQYHRRRANR